jgi:hypothetical protein
MRKLKLRPVLSLKLIILTSANSAIADTLHGRLGEPAWQPGWSGYVQMLAGGYSGDGLSDVVDGNEWINSLKGKSSRQEADFFTPLWQVNYRLSQSRTRLFIGTPEYSVVVNDVAFEAGLSHELDDGSVLWVAYVPELSEYRGEVWKDPYQTGQPRTRTETESESFRLGAEYIFGSPLSVNFESGNLSIDEDLAGESLRSRLSAVEIRQLRRSGKFRKAGLSVTLPLSDHIFLIPDVSYTDMDAKGSANSYDAIAGGFATAYADGPLEIFIHGQLSEEQYVQSNPVFNTKREDKHYSITAGVSYIEPFGLNDIQVDLIVGSGLRDSNIDFFESNSKLLAVGLAWCF